MENTYKVVLCGKTGVGKTSIFNYICGEKIESKKKHGQTTNEHECMITVKVDDTDVQLNILDTLGLEQYATLTRSYFLGSQAVLIVYSTDDSDSLEQASNCFRDAKFHSVGAAFIPIRNKIDLEATILEEDARSCFPENAFPLQFRTSAKTGEGIQAMIVTLASHLQKQAVPSRPAGCLSPSQKDCFTQGIGQYAQLTNDGIVRLNIADTEDISLKRRRRCCFRQ